MQARSLQNALKRLLRAFPYVRYEGARLFCREAPCAFLRVACKNHNRRYIQWHVFLFRLLKQSSLRLPQR